MADLQCRDGRWLSVIPVPVLARDGVPYEVTLELLLDGVAWGAVGERCGWFLQDAADRLAGGLLQVAGTGSRDPELFAFRARDPDDVATSGALRALVDVRRRFSARGWHTGATLRVEAWGDAGAGVLAELDEGAAGALLAGLLDEVAALHGGERRLPVRAAPSSASRG